MVWSPMKARSPAIPSTVDILFLLLVALVPLSTSRRLFGADGDIGRHLRVGEDILRGHSLFFEDHYSYTMQGQPFVPYEWLSEILFALAHRIGGLPAVAVLTGLVIAVTYSLVVVFLRRGGVDALLAFLIGTLSALLGSVHWLPRPHIFTSLGALLLLYLLERGRPSTLWLFVPLFVVWANLHGGFIYGLILIGVYLAGDLVEMVSCKKGIWLQRAKYHGAALVVSGLASFANPSGPRLFAHVTGYLGNRFLVDRTQEYMSPDFHELTGQLFLGVLILVVVVLALRTQRPSYPRLLLLAVNLAFALYSGRNIPLFAVTALPVFALDVDPQWRQLSVARRFRVAVANGELKSVPGVWASLGAIAMVLVGLNHGYIGGVPRLPSQFDASRFPVSAIERAREQGLEGRIFNQFAWGGYILYAWPEQKVFIDGQTDFYGEDLLRAYLQIAELQAGWRQALKDWDISLVIASSDAALIRELGREPGWNVWYRDGTATILQRSANGWQQALAAAPSPAALR